MLLLPCVVIATSCCYYYHVLLLPPVAVGCGNSYVCVHNYCGAILIEHECLVKEPTCNQSCSVVTLQCAACDGTRRSMS